jgi:hypothetical protein
LDRLPICSQLGSLSNDVPMSPSKDSDRPASAMPDRAGEPSANGDGVLSKLPRTRPQRSSPRRAAARAASAAAPAGARSSAGRQRVRGAGTRAARSAAAKVSVEPAPRQGFESETERANGTVHPPGGADLVASAAEIVGELAKAGVSKGERLLKDLLSRLPLT